MLIIKIQGVSAPVIGSTSLENLYDLLGMRFYFNPLFWLRGDNLFFFFSIDAVNVKLTEEEKKELEAPYIAQVALGHS